MKTLSLHNSKRPPREARGQQAQGTRDNEEGWRRQSRDEWRIRERLGVDVQGRPNAPRRTLAAARQAALDTEVAPPHRGAARQSERASTRPA